MIDLEHDEEHWKVVGVQNRERWVSISKEHQSMFGILLPNIDSTIKVLMRRIDEAIPAISLEEDDEPLSSENPLFSGVFEAATTLYMFNQINKIHKRLLETTSDPSSYGDVDLDEEHPVQLIGIASTSFGTAYMLPTLEEFIILNPQPIPTVCGKAAGVGRVEGANALLGMISRPDIPLRRYDRAHFISAGNLIDDPMEGSVVLPSRLKDVNVKYMFARDASDAKIYLAAPELPPLI